MKDKEVAYHLEQIKVYCKVASEEKELDYNAVQTAILLFFPPEVFESKQKRKRHFWPF